VENSSKSYPIIIEISKNKKPFKVDIKDPNFYNPISCLNKQYEEPVKKVYKKIDYSPFEIISPN